MPNHGGRRWASPYKHGCPWERKAGYAPGRWSGDRLRELREAELWTREDLAHYIGVSLRTICRWEAGADPGPLAAAVFSVLFRRSFGYFFPEPPPEPKRRERVRTPAASMSWER